MLKAKLLSYLDIESAYFDIKEGWQSGSSEHRQVLRSALLTALKEPGRFPHLKLAAKDEDNINDLTAPPQIEHFSISVSHCPLVGGFVICPIHDGHVGLDLEDRTKVTPEIVARMCSEEETFLAPDPALLWAAKEATFKSLLKASQPKALSEIVLLNWYTIESKIWGFNAQIRGVRTGPVLGLAALEENLVVGLAKFTP